ncbi:MAG: TOBE domain-containing protein, partial [Burkholderiales bacterium]|nr:TOBE domain-containing protein [Burkholderiales bacterium]
YLFDEPLSNLDAQLRVDMRTEIKKLHQRLKATIVYVTHDQIEAMTLATRIAVMKGGVMQQLGTPNEVYNRPANTFVASFMGSPRMNLVKARVAGHDGAPSLDIQAAGHPRVGIPLPASMAAVLRRFTGQEVIAGIRAEAVSLARDGMVAGANQCFVEARVEVIEPTGADTLVVLDMGGSEFTVRLEPDVSLKPEQQARFLIDLTKLVCFDVKTEMLIA